MLLILLTVSLYSNSRQTVDKDQSLQPVSQSPNAACRIPALISRQLQSGARQSDQGFFSLTVAVNLSASVTQPPPVALYTSTMAVNTEARVRV